MASLRDVVREYQDELRDGTAWLVVWRDGCSWHGETLYLDVLNYLYYEAKRRLLEIQAVDPQAIIVHGYYTYSLSEKMKLDELAASIRRCYKQGDEKIDRFIEAHDLELPEEVLENARAMAHAEGLPFYEGQFEEFDPYVYDGRMSVEDYKLMWQLLEQDKESLGTQTLDDGFI